MLWVGRHSVKGNCAGEHHGEGAFRSCSRHLEEIKREPQDFSFLKANSFI